MLIIIDPAVIEIVALRYEGVQVFLKISWGKMVGKIKQALN